MDSMTATRGAVSPTLADTLRNIIPRTSFADPAEWSAGACVWCSRRPGLAGLVLVAAEFYDRDGGRLTAWCCDPREFPGCSRAVDALANVFTSVEPRRIVIWR